MLHKDSLVKMLLETRLHKVYLVVKNCQKFIKLLKILKEDIKNNQKS